MSLREQMIVRPACREDVDSIVAFSAAMALETEGRELDHARLHRGTEALLASPERGFFMVAELAQGSRRLIGQLMITYEWSDWRNGVFWWVQSVYVAPTWRRQGVYRSMHNVIVSQARSRPDVCGIRLYVDEHNAVAQSVYKAMNLHRTFYQIWEAGFVL